MPSFVPIRLNRWRAVAFLVAAGLGLIAPVSAFADEPANKRSIVGATFDTLQVGKTTYQRVQVRSINARTLVISHSGGIASIRLRDLSAEQQAAFGYDPAADASAESALRDAQSRSEQERAKQAQLRTETTKTTTSAARLDRLMQSFGRPPEVRPNVDLRPKYFELGLNVKNQGIRPSCAVFAIVSALEFQNAQITGKPELFSEEYLLWATCKTLNRPPRVAPVDETAEPDSRGSKEVEDEGFALSEVVTALRAYGIPLQTRMPYLFGRGKQVDDPPRDVVEEARAHQRVSVYALPGRDQPARLGNLVQALNEGVPVAVGMRWPPSRLLAGGYLSEQKPRTDGGHAVTLVGYENKTGVITDTVFIFKNSWGIRWGSGGYGYATYAYMTNNLMDAAVLEVVQGQAR